MKSSRQTQLAHNAEKTLCALISDKTAEESVACLENAMRNASVNYRHTKPLSDPTRGAYGYELEPDYPTRIVAAKLLLQMKFELGSMAMPLQLERGGAGQDDFRREDVIGALAAMGADLGDLATFWIKQVKQVAPMPARELRAAIEKARLDVLDIDEVPDHTEVVEPTAQPVDKPTRRVSKHNTQTHNSQP